MFKLFKSIKSVIDSIWEVPIFYKILQETLAKGGHSIIKKFLTGQIRRNTNSILDQGCGTGEYALLFGGIYTGIDNNSKDIEYAKKRYPGKFIVGSAADMKNVKSNNFDIVFSVGLHHHLTDKLAGKAIKESIRVTKRGGKIIIIDAMFPKNPLNIIGLFLRKLDRGGNVRKVKDTLKLIPSKIKYKHKILSSFPFDYITIVINKI